MAAIWDWLDPLAGVVFRASLAAALLSSLVVLAQLGTCQPVRRIAMARGVVLGALVLIPLMGLTPLPRFDLKAALRGAGILQHPLLLLPLPLSARAVGALGLSGVWPARGLLVLYLAGVRASLAVLIVGFWGLAWLTRHSNSPCPEAQRFMTRSSFSGRRPRLRVVSRLRRPVLVGILRPTILIPAALDAHASDSNPGAAQSLRLSFLHELAHAERSDPWFSLLASLAQAVWFFLPTFWWIRSRMHLDDEFLADQRAALGFDAPSNYASALVTMARPHPESRTVEPLSEPLLFRPDPVGGMGSRLLQRVLMLVQCPFPVEPRPPAWLSWSLPILTLLITTAAACLGLALWPDTSDQRRHSLAQVPRTFQVARLAIGPQKTDPQGRAPAFELPLDLPKQFELTLEVWGDRGTLSGCRVVGQQLGLPVSDLDRQSQTKTSPAPAAWHHVQLQRRSEGLSLAVDGETVPCHPGLSGITPRLSVESPPDGPTLVRNLRITW